MSQTTTRPEAAPVSDETRRDRIIAAFNDNTDAGRLKATNEAAAAQQSNPNFGTSIEPRLMPPSILEPRGFLTIFKLSV